MNQSEKKTERLLWIDAWRGLAVLGMIAVHIAMILDFGEIIAIDAFTGGWYIVTQLVRWSFLGLVGVSMVIMLRSRYAEAFETGQLQPFWEVQMRRAGTVAIYALGASALSWIAYPELFIRFGVLHLIAVCIVACMWMVHLPKVAFMLGTGAALFGWALGMTTTTEWWLHWIGVAPAYVFSTMDFFPLFPWLAVPLFGISFGHWLYEKNRMKRLEEQFRELTWAPVGWLVQIGQKALKVYAWHGAVLLAVIFVARQFFF